MVSSHFCFGVPIDYLQVVTYKNFALNNFLLDCIKKVSSPNVKIVRVGTVAEDADERLKQCLLREVCWLINHKYKHKIHSAFTKCPANIPHNPL